MKRFWDKVKKTDACWEWQACCVKNGYGQFRADGGSRVYAHRMSWSLSVGQIPCDMDVLHECDNRKCVNPAHLFLGTNQDNIDDKVQKNRQSRGSRSNRTDLTEQDVLEILRLHRSGISAVRIAGMFPTSRQAIGEMVKGKSWKHVDRALVN